MVAKTTSDVFKNKVMSGLENTFTDLPASAFAAMTSAELAAKVSDETGTGALVFATSPTLVTPALGTPASGNLANCTNYPTATSSVAGLIPTYVKGTFTPSFAKTGGSGSISGTPTVNYARYVKVGSLCTVYISISNIVVITNTITTKFTLPFTALNSTPVMMYVDHIGTPQFGRLTPGTGTTNCTVSVSATSTSFGVGTSSFSGVLVYEVSE